MIVALKLAWLVAILCGSLGPGLLIVRRLRLSPLERLCAAIVCSHALLYLLAGTAYLLATPGWVFAAIAAGCLACLGAARSEMGRLAADRGVLRAVAGFGLLFCWVLLLLSMVRSYSGGRWELDWLEHYQRAVFFIEHQPLDARFTGYPFTARPPMMNLLAAHFLSASAVRFEFFQVAFAFLNLSLLIPAILLLRLFSARAARPRATWVLLCLLAASPFVLQNAAYSWTKGLAVFHVLAGLWFYLRALRRNDAARLTLAGVAFASGTLVHYSAAPFALFAAAHAVRRLLRGSGIPLRNALLAALPAALLGASWIGWSWMQYGLEATLGSTTTTVQDKSPDAWAYLLKVWGNLVASVIPHPLRVPPAGFQADFFQLSSWGLVRDYAFAILQSNLVFAVGTVGGIALLLLVPRAIRSEGGPASGRRYWWAFLGVLGLATVAVNPEPLRYGTAHVASQPLVFLGFVLLAARFGELPRWLRRGVIAGAAADFAFGAFLHFALQHRVLPLVPQPPNPPVVSLNQELGTISDVANGIAKHAANVAFLGDHFAGLFILLATLVLAGATALCLVALRQHNDVPRPRSGWGLAGIGAVSVLLLFGFAVIAGVRSKPRPLLAEEEVRRALDPAAPVSSETRGIALALVRQFPAALDHLGAAFALDPRPGRPQYLGNLYTHVHRFRPSPAAVAAEQVVRKPKAASAHRDLGLVLLEIGHPEAAAGRLEHALELAPRDPENVMLLAEAWVAAGRTVEAIGLLQSHLSPNSSNPEFHFLLAGAYHRANRTADSIRSLRETLRLDPRHPEAIAALRQLGQRVTP